MQITTVHPETFLPLKELTGLTPIELCCGVGELSVHPESWTAIGEVLQAVPNLPVGVGLKASVGFKETWAKGEFSSLNFGGNHKRATVAYRSALGLPDDIQYRKRFFEEQIKVFRLPAAITTTSRRLVLESTAGERFSTLGSDPFGTTAWSIDVEPTADSLSDALKGAQDYVHGQSLSPIEYSWSAFANPADDADDETIFASMCAAFLAEAKFSSASRSLMFGFQIAKLEGLETLRQLMGPDDKCEYMACVCQIPSTRWKKVKAGIEILTTSEGFTVTLVAEGKLDPAMLPALGGRVEEVE